MVFGTLILQRYTILVLSNVGHLVGKMSFISAKPALLASLQTSMIGSTMLDRLKETDPNILSRVTGADQKEKQNVIFF